MCGIAGGFWRNHPADLDLRMAGALDAMKRRGPDDRGVDSHQLAAGIALLGHTRLSIIDLSDAGHQPMYSPCGRYGLVFNGEIYNYLELREELAASGSEFRTNSDTEVLLAAWQQWGTNCLGRLKGMFAFAVLDRASGTLSCVRDAFGIKPFFYAVENDAFLFGSEMAALRALLSNRAQLDWQRAYDYLVHGEYDFGTCTFVQGVASLLPGHFFTVDLATLNASEPVAWWQPSIEAVQPSCFDEASDRLRILLLENVRLHMRSDVPLGAALSGGLDSSAIVCLMRYLEPDADIHTFSYIAHGSLVSEESWVDMVNGAVNAKAHKVMVSADDLASDLEDLIATQGEPFGSTSIYAQYRVFRLAREHGITVTLDGQGADELMGGYNGYPGQRIRSLLDLHQYQQAWSFLKGWSCWPGRNGVEGLKRVVGQYSHGVVHDLLRKLNGMKALPNWIEAGSLRDAGVALRYPFAEQRAAPGRRMMAALALSVSERGLLGLLRHGDRNSMRFSVESRVPFLTQDLADFMFSLPESYLVSPKGETKHLLRHALRGIVPEAVLQRRDKIGFATPESQWLIGMAKTIRPWLKEDLNLPFLDQTTLVKEFDEIVSGQRSYTWQVWRWVNFAQWYKRLM